MGEVESISRTTAIFFSSLVAATIIERTIEILMAVLKFIEMKTGLPDWNAWAKKLQVKFDRLYFLQTQDPKASKLFDSVLWKFVTTPSHVDERRVIVTDLIRANVIRLSSHFVSFALAVVIVISLEYDLIAIIIAAYPDMAKLILSSFNHTTFNTFLTALAISLGVQPLHQIISRVEKRLDAKLKKGEVE